MGLKKNRSHRDNPLDRLRHLHPTEIGPEALRELLYELQVYEEELTAQNTQLIETQHALEESRDRYVDLYDFAPIGFMTISVSGIIREINLTGVALLHQGERSQIIGLPFNAFVAGADKSRFAEHLRQLREMPESRASVELTLNGDARKHIQLVTRPHAVGTDKAGLLTALIDITDRRRLELERHDAEETRDKLTRDRELARARADAKDHFLAMLSHELRTPLTPIMATMTDDRLVSLAPEPLLAALHTARRNLDLEVRLIDDLLDFTRISRDRLVLATERVDVHEVLHDVVEMLDHEFRLHGVHVATALDAPRQWVIGDPTRLRQVFWNLMGNAIKFSSWGGTVTVSSSDAADATLQVTIRDTGEGMDEQVVNSINEGGTVEAPVMSATGLGLGLAICRGVIKAHKGALHAHSSGRGHGSTFVVQIPLAAHLEQWAQPRTSSAPANGEQSRPRRILLVEDHPDSADTLSQLLAFHDYEVSVARTMQEAIDVADHGLFDLLISDIRLPDGSGLDLMRRLRSNRPIRGIAISGFGTEQDQRRSREAGYETHLTKPVDFNVLLGAIERVAASGA